MRYLVGFMAFALSALVLAPPARSAAASDPAPAHPVVAATPPMGWTSWSSLHKGISEAIIEAEAQILHDKLRRHGFTYVNIDAGWQDHLDGFGRPSWDVKKFPDGIPAIAAFVHRLGLKLGIYLLPGIPKGAVAANLPIEGTPFHAQDIADTSRPGNTVGNGVPNEDAWRIDYDKPGATAYIQSYANLMASWGVDYIKMDFVAPGGGRVTTGVDNRADMEHWHYALQNTGRPIHLELSNSLSLDAISTWKTFTNGWRIEGDVECGSHCPGFITNWDQRVAKRFTDVVPWIPFASRGGWNDLDALEIGNGAHDGLTPDERMSTMTLWAIEASPLILGTDLRNLDPQDLALLRNDEVIAVDQAGIAAHPVSQATPQQVWFSKDSRGGVVVALFNLGSTASTVSVNWSDLGVSGEANARDLWSHRMVVHRGLGFSASLAPHASRLLRIMPDGD